MQKYEYILTFIQVNDRI